MNLRKYIFLIIFLFFIPIKSYPEKLKILYVVEDNLITNIDIKNEINYLLLINNELSKISPELLVEYSTKSLLREKIKEIELKKYFQLGVQDNFLNDRIGELYTNLGFLNSEEFQKHLSKFDLKIEDVAKKIEIELKWNKLVYDKYKDKIIIKENDLRKKIIEESKNKNVYNLSELIFSSKTEEENKKKIEEIIKSINDIGFENSVLIFSSSESRKNSGNLGWINEFSLSNSILKEIKQINISEITKPIKIQNSILILKLNDKKKTDVSMNIDEELRALIKFETNKQLNIFSSIYFEKTKKKLNINE